MEHNQESKQPDTLRSPGVTDRHAIIPENQEQEVEVVRRLVVPDVKDTPAKSNDSRSPGVTDRGISLEEMTAIPTQSTQTGRSLIVPEEVESENSSS
jgi:hypothetical protein